LRRSVMSVSLCMIVRDESANLAEALVAARDLVDEFVVVDTGSSDNTREIALRHGARVFDFAWCDDFAAARNESIRHARGQWVFWLDADDRIPERSRAKLRRLFDSLGPENAGYLLNVVSVGPDHQPIQEAAHVRVFRNDPHIRWDYRVHDHARRASRRRGIAPDRYRPRPHRVHARRASR